MIPNFATIWESVADVVPDAEAVVQGSRRVGWREYEDRSARLAQALLDSGLGPDSKVGMFLYNSPEYCETNFAALKIGGVPINVNYRYLDDELLYLLDNADVEALVFHTSLADRVARIAPRLDQVKLFVHVDDGPAADLPDGSVGYDELLGQVGPATRRAPTGREVYMFYTGGTTGMPKGVIYDMVGFAGFFLVGYPAQLGMDPFEDAADVAPAVAKLHAGGMQPVAMSCPPLMHGTGCWLGLMAPHLFGAKAVLLESRSLDPAEVWTTVETEAVNSTIIVGDAFARPLLRTLQENQGRWDASSLKLMVSSGAMFSPEVKDGLLDHLPGLAIIDVLGSTEGGMAQTISMKGMDTADTANFSMTPGTKVFTEDGREVLPGSDEIGLVAGGGMVPMGYYKDPDKSAATFKEIDGVRYTFPGDWAKVNEDGTLLLLGRGSNCINTGGEKVFPEEVEEVLKMHPAVDDSLVFGVPDERFGNRVVGVVALGPDAPPTDPEEIIVDAKSRLAAFKVPKEVIIVETVPRAPNGKADYPSAKSIYEMASGA